MPLQALSTTFLMTCWMLINTTKETKCTISKLPLTTTPPAQPSLCLESADGFFQSKITCLMWICTASFAVGQCKWVFEPRKTKFLSVCLSVSHERVKRVKSTSYICWFMPMCFFIKLLQLMKLWDNSKNMYFCSQKGPAVPNVFFWNTKATFRVFF